MFVIWLLYFNYSPFYWFFQNFAFESTIGDNIYFLSSDDQKAIENDFVSSLPWRSFGRKNVGYLYAIARGAKVIWDFDDDNFLKFWVKGASVDPMLDISTFTEISSTDRKLITSFWKAIMAIRIDILNFFRTKLNSHF